MTIQSYFGYPPVENFVACWGVRAIFEPSSSRPLDVLPDRQGVKLAVDDDTHKSYVNQIVAHLNQDGVLDDLNDLAGKWFSSDSNEKFIKHYPWGQGDSDFVLVAAGSPNGSYGYFYISVSLVKKSDAPDEQKPPEQVAEEERLERQRQRKQKNSKVRDHVKQTNKAHRKAGDAPHKEQGEILEVGDHFYISVNQYDRDAFVLAVNEYEAFAKYRMPSGREFLVVVDRDDHRKLRNVNATKVPQKWLKLIDVNELDAA